MNISPFVVVSGRNTDIKTKISIIISLERKLKDRIFAFPERCDFDLTRTQPCTVRSNITTLKYYLTLQTYVYECDISDIAKMSQHCHRLSLSK